MLSISPVLLALLGFLLAVLTALVTGGVAWGAFRAQLERHREEIHELRDEVRGLRTVVADLTTKLAVMADRHSREPSMPTPVHGIRPPAPR